MDGDASAGPTVRSFDSAVVPTSVDMKTGSSGGSNPPVVNPVGTASPGGPSPGDTGWPPRLGMVRIISGEQLLEMDTVTDPSGKIATLAPGLTAAGTIGSTNGNSTTGAPEPEPEDGGTGEGLSLRAGDSSCMSSDGESPELASGADAIPPDDEGEHVRTFAFGYPSGSQGGAGIRLGSGGRCSASMHAAMSLKNSNTGSPPVVTARSTQAFTRSSRPTTISSRSAAPASGRGLLGKYDGESEGADSDATLLDDCEVPDDEEMHTVPQPARNSDGGTALSSGGTAGHALGSVHGEIICTPQRNAVKHGLPPPTSYLRPSTSITNEVESNAPPLGVGERTPVIEKDLPKAAPAPAAPAQAAPAKGRNWKYYPPPNGDTDLIPVDVIDHESEVLIIRREPLAMPRAVITVLVGSAPVIRR